MAEVFLCAKCAELFESGYSLQEMERDNQKKHKCPQCKQKTYGSIYAVKRKEKPHDK